MKDLDKTAFSPEHTQKCPNMAAFIGCETASLQLEG